ncbi:Mitomycin radical oxidase [Baekduia alba]|uniref:FAD-binding oxidoreductase n=1 Tax=Baekduia alba TaxID=2997333 RepID=UPI0023421C29|nr:FAD-binding protein [Baekduia alba]WCB95738.1 Mitomycin radical oxidase [Baekduia alba]
MTTDLLPDLDGRHVLPSDDGYDDARRPWNTAIDQRPAAVVEAASVADVQAVVRHARANGLHVAPQSTGHGAEALAVDLRGAILLRTSRLNAIAVDAEARTARIGAGVTGGALARAAAEHGLAATLGLAPSVGVAGLALGGGIGWLSRVHGLASNAIRSIDVVTADGAARTVDADRDPDLFFALRGGGGRFAIVTGLELALHPVDAVSAGMLAWPAEATGEVLEQVRRWTRDAPEALSAVVRVLSLPPIEAIPAPIRGRRIVAVVAAYLGPHHDAERLIAPLRGGGGTLVDTFGPIAIADLVTVAGDPEAPGPARGDGLLLKDLTPDAVAAVEALVGGAAFDALTILELRQLGGALGRPAPAGHGALDRVDAGWAVFAGGSAPDAAAADAIVAAAAGIREGLAPYAAEQVLLNSTAAGVDPARAFAPETWARLARIHAAYDPDGLILAAHRT